MKRKIALFSLAIAAAGMLVAQTYKLVIHTTSGEQVSYYTSDIESMEFVPDGPQTLIAPTPVVTIKDGLYTVSWNAVRGAYSYSWKCGGSTADTSETSYTFPSLAPGDYEFFVKAKAKPGSGDTDSEYGSVKFTVLPTYGDEATNLLIVENYTHDTVRLTYFPSNANTMTAVVMPAAQATDDAAIIAYAGNADASAKFEVEHKSKNTFTGLTPSTDYVVALIDGSDVAVRKFTTEAKATTGSKGSVFAPGVTTTAGFVDVDKVGMTVWGESDAPMCWACASASMIQWWLNDFKAVTGKDYTLALPVPETSQHYSTPIMDLHCQAWTFYGGDCQPALQWFFAGTEYPEAVSVEGKPRYKLDYEYVHGGWGNMTIDEFKFYHEEWDAFDSWSGYNDEGDWYRFTTEQVKVRFGDWMIGWLRNGPVYFDIGTTHALVAWGADYTIQSDGSKLITKIYYTENDLCAGNLKDTLQSADVAYTTNDPTSSLNWPYLTNSSTISDGGNKQSGRFGQMVPLKSWKAVHGE